MTYKKGDKAYYKGYKKKLTVKSIFKFCGIEIVYFNEMHGGILKANLKPVVRVYAQIIK